MKPVRIYSSDYCPYCTRAKALLAAREPSYAEAALTLDTSGQDTARLVERIAEFVAKSESLAR